MLVSATYLCLFGGAVLSLAQQACDIVYEVGPRARQANANINICLKTAKVPYAATNSNTFAFETDPYNERVQYTPAALALPLSAQHVQAAVSCAAKSNLRVSAKSGGHSYASFGLGGENGHLVIDFHNMTNVTVDPDTNVATLQPGCRLGNVAQAIYAQGKRAMSHGTCPP
jgi:FAD/FMN-containing dehydrogenase